MTNPNPLKICISRISNKAWKDIGSSLFHTFFNMMFLMNSHADLVLWGIKKVC